jgi:hypothetical protein
MKIVRFGISVVLMTMMAVAQSDRGIITGTVQDPAHSMVPGAAVSAKNTETGAVYPTTTTGTGNFTITALPAGIYEVSVEAPGFRKHIGQGTQVQVAQTVRLDIILQVGATSDSVTVTAEASILKSDSTEQSVNVSGDRINALPLNFGGGGGAIGGIRTPLTFMVLSPGVAGTGTNARVNGMPSNTYRVFVDGQDVTNNNDNSSTAGQPSVEMIEEFSLQTSNFAAEFGQVAGGMFTFATRSGTNKLHGSLYEYFNNEALDATRPYVNEKPQSRKHDFGVQISGPIWAPKLYDGRNRTFFLLNWEQFRNDTNSPGSRNTVPTLAYRDGDFSGALTGRRLGTAVDPLGRPFMENTIYDPLTARPVNGQIVRDPFLGNIIPVSRLDPVALKIQALLPLPEFSGNINNWNQNLTGYKVSATPSMKLDHNFSSASKVSFYLQKAWNHTVNNGLDGLSSPITAVRDQRTYSYTTRLNYDHSLTPRLLLHTGAGFLRFLNPDSSPTDVLEYDALGKLGFRGSSTGGGFPRISGMSNAVGGGMFNIGPTNANDYWVGKLTVPLSITYTRNNHTYKVGAEYRLESYTDRNTRGASGVLAVSAAQTAQPYLQTTSVSGGSLGFPYASFLLGLMNTASVNAPQDPQWRNSRWGLFLQDTWKVTRKLTLDLGIRWDYQDQGHEIHYRNSMFGPGVPNPSAGGLLGGMLYEGFGPGRCNCKFIARYPYAIGPRVGFAYQIDPKTVLRGGWGIVYANTPTYQYFTNSAILGVGFDQLVFDAPGFGDPAITLRGGMVYNPADLFRVSLDPGLRPSPSQLNSPNYYLDPNGGRPGRINQISVNLQREVMRSLVVEAAYVANRGVWLTGATGIASLNYFSDARLRAVGLDRTKAEDRAILASNISSPAAVARGFRPPYAAFPSTATVAQSLRPYPQFNGALTPMWAPLGNSWYDSLQIKAAKRLSHGLDFTAAFTWSKELATGTGTNDVFNRPNQKSIVSTSQPLIFVLGFNYETPRFGPNKLLKAALGNWTLSGILRYASAMPIGVPGAQNNLSTHILQSTRMNRVPGEPLFLKDLNCHCIDPNKELVLNPKAWSDPAPGEWGYSAAYYDDFRFQRRPSEQLGIGRVFRIRELLSVEIRGEWFNAFNRTVMPNPSAGNPFQTPAFNGQGVPTAGFGRIDATTVTGQRNGQLVARLRW